MNHWLHGREGNDNPLQHCCLENPMDRGACWAAVYGVTQNQTWLRWQHACIGEGNGNPLQYSCLENPTDWGAWWAAVHGVTKSWTRLSDFTYLLLGRKAMTNLDSKLKAKTLFCWQKVSIVKAMVFSSSHVWMWKLDHKEDWVPKNWCFWTVVLEKALESSLDCKEIKPVNPNRNQPWIFIGRTDTEAETPILWPPDAVTH